MNRLHQMVGILSILLGFILTGPTLAAEHGGEAVEQGGAAVEHPGEDVEHPGRAIGPEFVKSSMKAHIDEMTALHDGVFLIRDSKLKKTWRLDFVKIHDPVRMFHENGQTIYFACTDFQSIDSDDLFDVDFWMIPFRGELKVFDTKIHKVNGKPRYTYEGTELKSLE